MINRKFAVVLASACLCLAAAVAEAQTRILPLGDSVTSSISPHSSYRYWLWHLLADRGYDVDFVGSQTGVSDGPPGNSDFDQNHEGHPGWATADAVEVIDSIASAYQPHVVLLDLGSNDGPQGIPLDITVANLHEIIETLRAVNPEVDILIGQPTPFEGQDRRYMSALRKAIRNVARELNTRESRVIAVNLHGGFNVRKDSFDGIHPDESGERKIAKKYFSAIKRVLR